MSQRILIVEDEPLINADLAAILVSQGYTIAGQAYDSVDAYDIIKEHTIENKRHYSFSWNYFTPT